MVQSPIQWILDLRADGLKIHPFNYNSTTPDHILNVDRPECQLLYKGIALAMGDFHGFVHGLVGATCQILHEQLLFDRRVHGGPGIHDDPTQAKTRWRRRFH